jgi:hypothetical protein
MEITRVMGRLKVAKKDSSGSSLAKAMLPGVRLIAK